MIVRKQSSVDERILETKGTPWSSSLYGKSYSDQEHVYAAKYSQQTER